MAEDPWRSRMVDMVRFGGVSDATSALLSLTYYEPDRHWLQSFLLECLEPETEGQVRALAVTCAGHVARLDHAIMPALVTELNALLDDPVLGGIAEDALSDVDSFAGGSSGEDDAS